MKIDLKNITDRQFLKMRIGVDYYLYIQKHYKDSKPQDVEDFRDVFTEFYMKAQGKMRASENREPFFDVMKTYSPNIDLIELVKKLHEEMTTDLYEFSFATKLLHTVNNDSPIFDSKVFSYLKKEENVPLWGATQGEDSLDRAKHNWPLLKGWYDNFMATDKRKAEWVAWFDSNFPEAKDISDVKKID